VHFFSPAGPKTGIACTNLLEAELKINAIANNDMTTKITDSLLLCIVYQYFAVYYGEYLCFVRINKL